MLESATRDTDHTHSRAKDGPYARSHFDPPGKSTAVCLVLAFLLASACTNNAQVMSPRVAAKWQAELHTLHDSLLARHVDLYHETSREEFERAVAAIEARLPSVSVNEALVEFARLIALVGDGHTSFYAGDQRRKTFGFIPLHLWSFSDGLYVTAAPVEYRHLVGKRITGIDQTPIQEAIRRVKSTIGVDNEKGYDYAVPFDLLRPELLHALGIATSADTVRFEFDGGVSEPFATIPLNEYNKGDYRTANGVYADGIPPSRRLEYLFATPLSLPHLLERKYYWWEYLEEENAIFFQYNTCWNQRDRPTVAEMAQEMFAFMDANPVEKLIIDLRQNTGGEPETARALIDGLAARPEFTEEGRLFVLVGRRTFSAAVTNAAELRSRANARLVGEAPRGKPNSPSEGRDVDLKRTGIWLTVSTQFVERDPALGDADFLPLEIEVNHTFAAYRDAVDLDLRAALNAGVLDI
ncbi:MAG: hypothetical protein JJ896_17555 [Rhodothermales bacterium]|nr:hypothetical protein [Rhodothermales bacterium]MBO6781468.1 hypothetical protein [Rhodothermales bacterium]